MAETVQFHNSATRKGVQEVELPAERTVGALLKGLGVTDTKEVRVNNSIASEATEIKPDDLVQVVPRVVGG